MISELDAKSGYWQYEADEEMKKLQVFSVREGQYQYNYMAMGTSVSTQAFQKVHDYIMRGFLWDTSVVFVDNSWHKTKWDVDEHCRMLE